MSPLLRLECCLLSPVLSVLIGIKHPFSKYFFSSQYHGWDMEWIEDQKVKDSGLMVDEITFRKYGP